MSNIIERDGFFSRIVQPTEEDGECTEIPLIDFIYGYVHHNNGEKMPTSTVCIIPFMKDSNLWFSIGVASCSNLDHPEKAYGRHLAETRARATIRAGHDLHWKPDYGLNGTRETAPICGALCNHKDIYDTIQGMYTISFDLHERILKSCTFLKSLTISRFPNEV